MIPEAATLDVIPGQESEFQRKFEKAQRIISSMAGYIEHRLDRRIEKPNRFILLVNRKTLDGHTIGFKESLEYQEWPKILHHYYDSFLTVEHYEFTCSPSTSTPRTSIEVGGGPQSSVSHSGLPIRESGLSQ